MAEKDLIEEFLKHFKISLTNAGIYFKNHPVLIRSIDKTKHILDEILSTINPFFIGMTPDSLLIRGEYLKEKKIYIELARHFHYRKIKSITFSKGVTIEELSAFLPIVSAPFRDIAKAGGIRQWISKESMPHINAQELDYSELLGDTGGSEDKDIWKFLIERAYQEKTFSSDLKKLSDHFEKIIYKFSSDDLKDDPSFMPKVIETLHYMKEEDPRRFEDCSKALVKFILDRNEFLSQGEITEKMRNFLKDIDVATLSEIIWEYNFENKKFNPLALGLFSKLLDSDTQKSVARDIENKFIANKTKFNDTQTRNKLKELVSSFDNKAVSSVYGDALNKILKHVEVNGVFNLEYEYIYENYVYSLLNMLCLEDKELRLEVIASCIIKEWPKIAGLKDINVVKHFLDTLEEKMKESSDRNIKETYSNIKNHIVPSLEDITLNNIAALSDEDVSLFSDFISFSKFEPQAYITKIMESESSKEKLIKLFIKFFPNDVNLLFNALRNDISRFESASNVINMLEHINTKKSLELLEDIFAVANPVLKIDILRAMQSMSVIDEGFILKLLKNASVLLRKESLKVTLRGSEHLKLKAVNSLLGIFNPFGIRNNVLIDNIRIIAEENVKEAKGMLRTISRKYYLWRPRVLKKTAQEALDKLDNDE